MFGIPPCPLCLNETVQSLVSVQKRDYFSCSTCSVRFLHPDQLPTIDEERREYDQHRNSLDDPGYRRFLNALFEPLNERLSPGSIGLDWGCGPGPALACMFEEAGHRMQVYDPIYATDPTPLKRRFDFISCTEVVEHFHRPRREFERLDHLLEPGGWLGIMTRFQSDDTRFANWHYRRDPTHVIFYRAKTMAWIAAHWGWRLDLIRSNIAILQKPA